MDEATVRRHAQSHADATVAGDLKAAGGDLDKTAYAAAGEVMKQLPRELESGEVTAAREEGEEWIVSIRYSGGSSGATVESRWAEREGRPKIVDLQVV